VQREDGNLDGEGDEECESDPPQSLGCEERGVVGEGVLQFDVVEGAGFGVEPQDGDEKERGWNEGVAEELEGSLGARSGPKMAMRMAMGTSESSQKP